MKKYDIPQIEIIHFLTEIFVSSSGVVHREYIHEIGTLESTLDSGQSQKRREDFNAIIQTNSN